MRLPGGYTISLPRALLAVLCLTIVTSIVIAGATSTAAFGAYNSGWDGGQAYRALASGDADTVVATNTSAYTTVDPDRTTAIVLSPNADYSARDIARVQRFVTAGGTLIVASDFGHGNDLLAGIGVDSRLDGRLVRDEEHHYRSPALPVTTVNETAPLTGRASSLTLNYATVLTSTGNATILAETSGYAYLDGDRDSELDESETLETRPVAAVERVGAGRVVAISDPSAFINRMLERPGNRAFARGLLADSTTVLFDYSHAPRLPPLQAFILTLRAAPFMTFGLLAALVFTTAAWTRGWTTPLTTRIATWWTRDTPSSMDTERGRLSHAEIERVVEQTHPDWSQARIQRFADRIDTDRD